MERSVIRRIKALLAKEGAEGTTPEEVAASLAMASRLLEREGLTRAALESEGHEPTETASVNPEPIWRARTMATWRTRLAATLARHHGCVVLTGSGSMDLAGRPSDVEIVRYLFDYCAGEIERLASALAMGRGRTYANNFRLGCVDAIALAIREEIKAERDAQRSAAAGTSALVAVENAIAKRDARLNDSRLAITLRYGKTRKAGPRYSQYNGAARAAGRSAGAGIYPSRRSGIGSGVSGRISG